MKRIYIVTTPIGKTHWRKLTSARTYAKSVLNLNKTYTLQDVTLVREIDETTRKQFNVFVPYETKELHKILERQTA